MTIASSVDSSQRDSDVKSKHSRNDEMKIINIIDLLTQTSMLEKEKSKDHSWKEVIDLKADSMFSKCLRKKDWKLKHVHHEECIEVEDIHSTS